MTTQKARDEVAKEFVDHHTLCDGEPHCPPYCNYQKFKRAFAQALRDAREAALEDAIGAIDKYINDRNLKIGVRGLDHAKALIRALKKGKV